MAAANDGFDDISSTEPPAPTHPDHPPPPYSVKPKPPSKKKKPTSKENSKQSDEGLENPRRRKIFRGFVNFVASIGAFFEQRLKVKGAEHSILRAMTRVPGIIESRTRGVIFTRASIADVPVRIYRPLELAKDSKKKTSGPGKYSLSNGNNNSALHPPKQMGCIVFLHGGLFCLGSARGYHKIASHLCAKTGALVICVDYRLAPENPFPAGLEDCSRVVRSILDDVPVLEDSIQFDRNRVIVMGDQSGGNFALCVALDLVRDPSTPRHHLHAVVAICPPLQAIHTPPNYRQITQNRLFYRTDWCLPRYAGISPTVSNEIRVLIREDAHLPREDFLRLIGKVVFDEGTTTGAREIGTVIPSQIVDLACNSRAWPLLADDEDLRELPCTLLLACDQDVLAAEIKRFADRIEANNGQVRFCLIKRAEHCEPIFSAFVKSEASRLARRQVIDYLKDQLARDPVVVPFYTGEDQLPSASAVSVEIHGQQGGDSTADIVLEDIVPRVLA